MHSLIGIKVNPQISDLSAHVLWEADSRRELEEQTILREMSMNDKEEKELG